jgi:Meiotically Up-regulated Gene 113 (MUG113) protein
MKTYFVMNTATRHVKIGRSGDPDQRIRSLQTASSVPLEVLTILDSDVEAEWHQRFAKSRVSGEWFAIDTDLARAMREELGVIVPPQGGASSRIGFVKDIQMEIEASYNCTFCPYPANDADDILDHTLDLWSTLICFLGDRDTDDDTDWDERQEEISEAYGAMFDLIEQGRPDLYMGYWLEHDGDHLSGLAWWLPRTPAAREKFLDELLLAEESAPWPITLLVVDQRDHSIHECADVLDSILRKKTSGPSRSIGDPSGRLESTGND